MLYLNERIEFKQVIIDIKMTDNIAYILMIWTKYGKSIGEDPVYISSNCKQEVMKEYRNYLSENLPTLDEYHDCDTLENVISNLLSHVEKETISMYPELNSVYEAKYLEMILIN